MLKKEVLGNASVKSLAETFRCGECLHHKKSPHASRKTVCSDEGVRAFAIAPKCFTPDVTKVISNAEQFVVLASLVNSFNNSQRRILIGMLRNNKAMKTKELKFGSKVYLKIGKDRLTSYLCGYVVGYTSAGELILTGNSARRSAGGAFFAYLKSDEGLLTAREWKIKRAELMATSAYDDSTRVCTQAMHDKYLNYEVPTIDTAPEAFETKPKRRKSKRASELTEFIVS